MRKVFLLLIFLLIPLVNAALNECQDTTISKNVPCVIKSSWQYFQCNSTEIKIYNATPTLILQRNFTDYGNSYRCNITWNISSIGTYFWNVSNGDSGHINIVQEEDNMASLAIMIFLMVITGTIFLMGKNGNFSKNVTLSFIIKRCLYLVGIFMLTVCMSAAFTFVKLYGLGLDNEFRMLLWASSFGAYIFEIFLLFSTIIVSLKLWKIEKQNKRMSYDG